MTLRRSRQQLFRELRVVDALANVITHAFGSPDRFKSLQKGAPPVRLCSLAYLCVYFVVQVLACVRVCGVITVARVDTCTAWMECLIGCL